MLIFSRGGAPVVIFIIWCALVKKEVENAPLDYFENGTFVINYGSCHCGLDENQTFEEEGRIRPKVDFRTELFIECNSAGVNSCYYKCRNTTSFLFGRFCEKKQHLVDQKVFLFNNFCGAQIWQNMGNAEESPIICCHNNLPIDCTELKASKKMYDVTPLIEVPFKVSDIGDESRNFISNSSSTLPKTLTDYRKNLPKEEIMDTSSKISEIFVQNELSRIGESTPSSELIIEVDVKNKYESVHPKLTTQIIITKPLISLTPENILGDSLVNEETQVVESSTLKPQFISPDFYFSTRSEEESEYELSSSHTQQTTPAFELDNSVSAEASQWQPSILINNANITAVILVYTNGSVLNHTKDGESENFPLHERKTESLHGTTADFNNVWIARELIQKETVQPATSIEIVTDSESNFITSKVQEELGTRSLLAKVTELDSLITGPTTELPADEISWLKQLGNVSVSAPLTKVTEAVSTTGDNRTISNSILEVHQVKDEFIPRSHLTTDKQGKVPTIEKTKSIDSIISAFQGIKKIVEPKSSISKDEMSLLSTTGENKLADNTSIVHEKTDQNMTMTLETKHVTELTQSMYTPIYKTSTPIDITSVSQDVSASEAFVTRISPTEENIEVEIEPKSLQKVEVPKSSNSSKSEEDEFTSPFTREVTKSAQSSTRDRKDFSSSSTAVEVITDSLSTAVHVVTDKTTQKYSDDSNETKIIPLTSVKLLTTDKEKTETVKEDITNAVSETSKITEEKYISTETTSKTDITGHSEKTTSFQL